MVGVQQLPLQVPSPIYSFECLPGQGINPIIDDPKRIRFQVNIHIRSQMFWLKRSVRWTN
jgi:hypothetical protein